MGSVRERYSRNVIPSEAEGSFSLAVRGSVFGSEKWETLYRRKGGDGASRKRLSEGGGKRGRKRFLAALEMTVWGNGYPLYRIKCALGKCSSCITISRYARNDRVENEYPVHHTKNVWETRSSRIVIPSEAEGSFSLAVRGRVSDSEKRETPYREKVGAVLLVNGLAKESWKKGTKKISRCARNDSVGNGYVFPEMSDAPKL